MSYDSGNGLSDKTDKSGNRPTNRNAFWQMSSKVRWAFARYDSGNGLSDRTDKSGNRPNH